MSTPNKVSVDFAKGLTDLNSLHLRLRNTNQLHTDCRQGYQSDLAGSPPKEGTTELLVLDWGSPCRSGVGWTPEKHAMQQKPKPVRNPRGQDCPSGMQRELDLDLHRPAAPVQGANARRCEHRELLRAPRDRLELHARCATSHPERRLHGMPTPKPEAPL